MVHETGNTFKVVTRKNQLKGEPPLLPSIMQAIDFRLLNRFIVLPKQSTVFKFSLPLYAPSPHSDQDDPRIELELYGHQFRFRAGERAGKKFKAKETIEL